MSRTILFILVIGIILFPLVSNTRAQNDACELSSILTSFEIAAASNSVEAWMDRYAASECESHIIAGANTLSTGFEQLSSISPEGVSEPCSLQAVVTSFKAAALSGEIDTWTEQYDESDCPSEIKRGVNTLSKGYLQITGQSANLIAYISNQDGDYEIYTMNVDGSERLRLTENEATDEGPDWSPDGKKLVFSSNRDGNFEIYVTSPNGKAQIRITNHNASEGFPSWSPDGSQIAFNSDRDGDHEIFVMNDHGFHQQQLTFNNVFDYWATWSPDGTRILFSSGNGSSRNIFIMNADGSDKQQLTYDDADDVDAVMSPDGQTIAFISNRTGTYELYFMNSDGSDQHQISLPPGDKFHPDWSQNGTQLVIMINPNRPVSSRGNFNAFDDGGWELYVLDVDGSNPEKITTNRFDEGDPDWSP